MQIIFDINKMHVQVICGILEKYQPNEKIEEIYKKVNDLKLKMEEFRSVIISPSLKEIQSLIDEENKKCK